MKPILGRKLEQTWTAALGPLCVVLVALFSAAITARADSTNFTGDFMAAFWTNTPAGFGSAYFTNASTELVVTGPKTPAAPETSLDGILYNGPLAGGLAVGGTVQFNWSYDSGDALASTEADFAWQPPGGGSPFQQILAQGGPGVVTSGAFTSPLLAAGTTFQFLLTTDTLANKLSGTLVVTDFQFHADVPEPHSGMIFAIAGLCFGISRRLRSRAR